MTADGRATSGDPAAEAWPAEHLERVGRCPVCGSGARTILFEGLSDRVFRAAPGRWTLWSCSGCGAAYLDPRPGLAGIHLAYRTYYTHAAPWARTVFSEEGGAGLFLRRLRQHAYYNRAFGYALRPAFPAAAWPTWLSAARRARADQLIRHLPAPGRPGRRLLDVGCGQGEFLRVARGLGFDAIGLDLDATAAARGREVGLEILVGTLEDAALELGSFDHVTMSHVVEHLHDPVGTLRRVLALLRPGGRVWIQTPNVEAEGLKRFGTAWRGLEPPRHLTLFGPASLDRAIVAAGFAPSKLLAPRREAEFYFTQSAAVERGVPVDRLDRAVVRQLRAEARRTDRLALRHPERGECITVVAHRPGA